jgi:hypothetical protein
VHGIFRPAGEEAPVEAEPQAVPAGESGRRDE